MIIRQLLNKLAKKGIEKSPNCCDIMAIKPAVVFLLISEIGGWLTIRLWREDGCLYWAESGRTHLTRPRILPYHWTLHLLLLLWPHLHLTNLDHIFTVDNRTAGQLMLLGFCHRMSWFHLLSWHFYVFCTESPSHVLGPLHFIWWIEAKYKPSTHQELPYLNFDLTN